MRPRYSPSTAIAMNCTPPRNGTSAASVVKPVGAVFGYNRLQRPAWSYRVRHDSHEIPATNLLLLAALLWLPVACCIVWAKAQVARYRSSAAADFRKAAGPAQLETLLRK